MDKTTRASSLQKCNAAIRIRLGRLIKVGGYDVLKEEIRMVRTAEERLRKLDAAMGPALSGQLMWLSSDR